MDRAQQMGALTSGVFRGAAMSVKDSLLRVGAGCKDVWDAGACGTQYANWGGLQSALWERAARGRRCDSGRPAGAAMGGDTVFSHFHAFKIRPQVVLCMISTVSSRVVRGGPHGASWGTFVADAQGADGKPAGAAMSSD